MCSAALRGRKVVTGDGDWLGKLSQALGIRLAAYVGLLMVAVHWFRAKSERMRDGGVERGAVWDRIMAENARLDARCIRLEEAEERCRNELADVKGRLSALEGYKQGEGDALQAAQRIVSAERELGMKLKDNGNG
jgi:hypothetical protein